MSQPLDRHCCFKPRDSQAKQESVLRGLEDARNGRVSPATEAVHDILWLKIDRLERQVTQLQARVWELERKEESE